MKLSKFSAAALIAFLLIVIDQVVKFYVKTHFYLGESVEVTSWFKILFIENNGMAFGMELGSKILLTLARILIVSFLIWYLWKIRNDAKLKWGYVMTLSLIIGGAIGNILDCIFYGVIFNNPYPPEIASFLPEGGGYAPLLMGKVVDMLYFPLFSFVWPQWVPFVGGQEFLFFEPVFNIADAGVSVGIILLLIAYTSQISDVRLPHKTSDD